MTTTYVMVATDFVTRGFDTTGTTVVVNYDFPELVDSYLLRAGKCGRLETEGKVHNFINPDHIYLKEVGTYFGITFKEAKL